ncbi:MAG: deoxyribodipyrimidine photo-lyase [Ilumatobacteraceae bacterium]|nr:deoxyribodipyrimidine photo-lyase [Ilumatobacteraceae bacterium]
MTSVWWIRRDLRLDDNAALGAACADGPVVPVFVVDPIFLRHSGAPRLQFLFRTLEELNTRTGGALVIRVGDPATEIVAVAQSVGAKSVFAHRDFVAYGQSRDIKVAAALQSIGAHLVGTDSPYVVDPGTIRKDDGTPVRVFTPFYKRWQQVSWQSTRSYVTQWLNVPTLSVALPEIATTSTQLPPVGQDAAWSRWSGWSAQHLGEYKESRNMPGVDGTSMMSPYLRFGVVHPRQLISDLPGHSGADVFRSEIAWREFYADVLFHRPDSMRKNLQTKMDVLPVDTDAAAQQRFVAWSEARTGYPIIDAGIRQMLATGWMHNRVRMIVASFLVKDLHVPWQWGARFFMKHLVDGDIASNNHGWQWTAGTGTDASPYFRVFNPFGQSAKFDPTGDYLRHWIPEISDLDDEHVHAPWTLGLLAPANYPAPMVDHAAEREEALARYKAVSGK